MKCRGVVITILALLPCIHGCAANTWREYIPAWATGIFGSAGTSVPAKPAETLDVGEQKRRLAVALKSLGLGNEQNARELLEQVILGNQQSGITDEALFRLSLLQLRDGVGKGSTRVQELLERLRTEYPLSIWAHQGAPLAAYLKEVKQLRDQVRENKSLKELNLSLSRDNREMRQSIERLKNLDMELEQKIKR